MRLKGLDIILTYRCTGRCAHCCYRAGPSRSETMTAAEVAGYLSAAADLAATNGGQALEWILLSGGEPFLFPDLLRASVALAARLAPVLVFTNGYWATGAGVARQRLADLQRAGLDHILFSVDAFHQAHVPLERIATGIDVAREMGYGTIEIDNRFLGEPDKDNFFNRRTREIMSRLAELCDLTGVVVSHGPSRVVGRAADQLSPYLATRRSTPAECPLPGYLGGDLRATTGLEIHPGGWVNLCAGLALGNALQRPLGEILAGYDPNAHPIIRILAQEGPPGLLRLGQRHGYSPAGGYVDGCHLCYQVRRFLRSRYPSHLAPVQPYSEGSSMQLLRLQSGVVYGPIESRRLGRSLGVNLLPTDRKLCSFDCIYCHYGHTDLKSLSLEEGHFPSVAQVLDAVEGALRICPDVDSITFSGNGEPTLHPHFSRIASAVCGLRDERRPDAKLAILSNATTVHLPHVREALGVFDAPIMKLDAGDSGTLASINRPVPEVELETIIEGLRLIPALIIQSVLIDGKVTNTRGDAFEAWLSAICEIRPAEVQIYSTDRPVPESGVERVPPPALERIAAEIERRTGVKAIAYWARV